jgi:hypothetical protein
MPGRDATGAVGLGFLLGPVLLFGGGWLGNAIAHAIGLW